MLLVFLVACHLLAQWQFARRAEARIELDRIERNYSSSAVPLREAVPELASFDLAEQWQPVLVTGEYDSAEEVLVRNRPYNAQPGFAVLTPFRTTEGTVFWIDRGWVSGASQANTPAAFAPPPTGVVQVQARLLPGEPATGKAERGNQIASIDLGSLADRVDRPSYTAAYGQLVAEPGSSAPFPALPPVKDEGPHLSYALQWYVFAIIAIIGFLYAARQERRGIEDDAGDRYGGTAPAGKRAARNSADADAAAEDRLLDAQER